VAADTGEPDHDAAVVVMDVARPRTPPEPSLEVRTLSVFDDPGTLAESVTVASSAMNSMVGTAAASVVNEGGTRYNASVGMEAGMRAKTVLDVLTRVESTTELPDDAT